MGKHSKVVVGAIAILGLGFFNGAGEALTIDLVQDWSAGQALSGDSTYAYLFDLSAYNLDDLGTTINAVHLSLITSGVDTNANIPASGSSGGGATSKYSYQYQGDLTDTLTVEGLDDALVLPGGTGTTSVDLLAGTGDYDYLRDGSLNLLFDINETNSWKTSGYTLSGTHNYTSPVTRTGRYWEKHGFYFFGIWIDTGSHWEYYTYTDYVTSSINDYSATYTPNYDGSLNLNQIKLTIDYTPASTVPIPEPASMSLLGLGIALAALRRRN